MKQSFALLLISSFFFLSGCKATYPQEKVEESIKRICREEYHITVETCRAGLTVYAYVNLNILSPNLTLIDKQTIDSLSNVLNSLSRVALSSDAPFQFIALYAESNTGIQITLIRYVDDIRRLLTGDISNSEFFDRLVIRSGREFMVRPTQEIQLSDFLADQIAQRMKNTLQNDLLWSKEYLTQDVAGTFIPLPDSFSRASTSQSPGPSWFTNSIFFRYSCSLARLLSRHIRRYIKPIDITDRFTGYGIFQFKLNLNQARSVPNQDVLQELNTAVIEKILRRYNFSNYKEIQLIDMNRQRTLVIQK